MCGKGPAVGDADPPAGGACGQRGARHVAVQTQTGAR